MMLDLVSKFDHFSGSGFGVPLLYWFLSLGVLVIFLNGSSYWMAMNWTEAFVLGLLSFDPANLRDSRAFSDPGYSLLVCSAWLVVGFMGFLSLCPYYDDMAREPAFIYSVTMVLWWYALLSYGMSSFRHFWYSLFLSSKSATFFIFLLILETVSWISRGMTFGARFVVSGMFGTGVSYSLASYFSVNVSVETVVDGDTGLLSSVAYEMGQDMEGLASAMGSGKAASLVKELPSSDPSHYFPIFKWQSEWLNYSGSEVLLEMMSAIVTSVSQAMHYLVSSINYGDITMVFLMVAWNFYELAMMVFQCYLIGLLGICFCVSEPMGYSNGAVKESAIIELKRSSKVKFVAGVWGRFSGYSSQKKG
uniref:ATP synthase F0 subunit 6 n=1 Tax=Tridacna gigas TaxID=80829 RepID=A0A7G8QB96_TRIGG|nr:ATP synthase F0 subunit 6 [Tridacna gigas]QNK04054.1 ATP synthase F0 subunit 6 [Tridacna gigas]